MPLSTLRENVEQATKGGRSGEGRGLRLYLARCCAVTDE
jgi:hypothetical protein